MPTFLLACGQRPGMARDNKFLVGGNDPNGNPAVRLADTRAVAMVCGVVQTQPQPGQALADGGAHRGGVFADAAVNTRASIPSRATAWLAMAWLIR